MGGSVSSAHLHVYTEKHITFIFDKKTSETKAGCVSLRSALDMRLTHLGNSAGEGGVSVFLVHVDCFSSGQVSEDNTVVLDDTSMLLVDLLN